MKRSFVKVIASIAIIATLIVPTISSMNTNIIGSHITPDAQYPEPGE
jgi:hypothetical protein